jgi:PAS domain S-box-containing protein
MAENDKPRESTRLYKELFSHIETGLAILCLENCDDPRSLRLIAANPAARRAAGISVEECDGKLLVDAAPKLVEMGIAQACAEVVRRGQARDLGQIESSDEGISGAVFGVKVRPLPDDCAAVIFEDISEHKQAQEALELAAKRFELASLATQDALFDWDLVSHEIWRNENYQRLFGAPERSLDSDNWWLEHLHPNDRERVLTAQQAALGGEGNLCSSEFRLRRPDGSYAHVVERSFMVRDARSQVVRTIGALTDITERKRAEERLLESEDRYRDLVEHSSDLICTHDLNGRLLSVNQIAARALGYTPDEMLGIPMREFLAPEVRERFDAYLGTIAREGSARGLMVIQTRAGEKRIWEYSNTLRTKGVPAPIVRGMAHDVTERVQAEKGLRESQRRLELIARASNTGLWDWDLRTNLVYYSPEWESQIGYAGHELSNRLEEWETRVHPEDLSGAMGRVRDYLADPQGEFENEFRFRHKDGSYRWILARSSVLKDDHGKPYRMLGSHLDITERKRAEEELFRSRQMLQSVLDHIPQGVFWKDRSGVYLGGNKTFAVDAALATPDQVPGKTDFALAWGPHPQTSAYRADDQLIMENDSPKLDYEEVMPQPGGHVSWVRTSKIPLHDREGKVIGILGTYEDITERKRSEEALRESEERFRSLVENATVGIYRTTPEGHILMANPVLVRMLGFDSSEELAARNLECEGFASSYPRSAFRERIEREGQVIGLESAWVRRDGAVIFIRESARAVRAGDGRILYYDGIVEDVTERKRAEEASRESEERYRTLFENSPVGIYRTTADGRILAGNPAFAQMLGYSSCEELASRNLNAPDFEPQYSRGQFTEKLEKEGRITGLESQWRRRDGSVIFVRENARAIQDEAGRILYYEGTAEDITERKRAEEALLESQALLNSIVNSTSDLIWSVDVKSLGLLWFNQGFVDFFLQRFGIRIEEGMRPEDLLPTDDLKRQWAGFYQRALGEGSYTIEYHMKTVPRTLQLSFNVLTRAGVVFGVSVFAKDITERKRAEEALRESEARFRTVFENAGIGMGLVDTHGNSIETNLATQRMLGYSGLELKQMPNSQYTHPDDAQVSYDMFRELAEGKRDRYHLEKRYLRKDGQIVWARLTESLVRNKNGEPQYAIAMMEDITDRKRAEEALRESEARFRAIFENAAVGIGLVDMQGHPVESNPALQKMLGYNPHELAQMAFTEFTHPADAQADWDLFAELVEGKRDKYQLDKRFYRKDGEVVWGQLTASVVRNKNGDPDYAIGMVEDITERKRAGEALRELSGRLLRLQDEERRRIARELHDTTAQSLAALAMNLSVVKDSAPDLSPRANACLAESLELAEECSREIRTLSYLLHPPLLDEAGLASAMRWFVDGYTQRTGIHVELEVPPESTRLPGDIELALYRVVQEGLTNIRLHSGSTKAHIRLKCRRDQAVLTVADEGRGIPSGLLERGGRRGAKLGVGIPGMRERIRQLGGQFEIVTGSKGTTLTASVPLREEPA